MNIKNINARTIGLVFASTLLIPSNYGLNILGLNFEDLPLVFLFLFLFYKKIINYDHISNVDKVFLSFVFSFILYSNIFTQNSEIFNQTNLRFYFYFIFSYLCVDVIRENNENLITVFEHVLFKGSPVLRAGNMIHMFFVGCPFFQKIKKIQKTEPGEHPCGLRTPPGCSLMALDALRMLPR